jgi:hypothetical protein
MREEFLYLALFILILFFLLILKFKKKPPLKYKRLKNIFTKSEREFFLVLKDILPSNLHIFAKVRVADVLLPKNCKDKSRWRSAFNKVACKHFDYVVCDERLNILFAIELDDKSHNRKDRVKRDIFINSAAKGAGFKLYRIPLQKDYDKVKLKKMLKI